MTKCFLQAVLALTLFLVTSSRAAPLEVIDLMYTLDEGAIGWPVHPPYNFSIVQRGIDPHVNNLYLEYNKFNMGEHRGTHADSPAHFAEGHWRSHEIPPSRLVGPGVVVDVSAKVRDNPLYKMTMEDVQAWEAANGRIPDGAIFLMNSGWGERYPDPQRVFNTDDVTNTSTFRYPSISPEVGVFLADERNVTAVGGDSPSPDSPDSTTPFPNHLKLLFKDILILENVANVDKLPPSGTLIVIGMIKLHDGSGGPTRILAIKGLPAPPDGTGGSSGHSASVSAAFIAVLLGAVLKVQ
ncbi:hypothetical protein BaRGS_00012059 [Batillaria attramentaria]|uniref:Cyclase n=2 Tax=Batillaria attramentaria TaxID=370345 RepID=A0ABD0LAU7_9CAEN